MTQCEATHTPIVLWMYPASLISAVSAVLLIAVTVWMFVNQRRNSRQFRKALPELAAALDGAKLRGDKIFHVRNEHDLALLKTDPDRFFQQSYRPPFGGGQ